MRLADKIAIITGAAQGIGKAYALRFATEGAHVIVADLREDAAHEVADQCSARGPDAVAMRLDVADEASALDVVARTIDRFGRVDVLVNNAAIYYDLDRTENTLAYFNRVLSVNLTGAWPLSCRPHRPPRPADAAVPLQRGEDRRRRPHEVHGGGPRPVGHQRQCDRA